MTLGVKKVVLFIVRAVKLRAITAVELQIKVRRKDCILYFLNRYLAEGQIRFFNLWEKKLKSPLEETRVNDVENRKILQIKEPFKMFHFFFCRLGGWWKRGIKD